MFCRQSIHTGINSVCGTKVPGQSPWTPSINDIRVLIQIKLKARTLRKQLQKAPPPLKREMHFYLQMTLKFSSPMVKNWDLRKTGIFWVLGFSFVVLRGF